MKTRIKKISALILSCTISLAAVACTSSKDKEDKKDKDKIGRYIEKKYKIPNNRNIDRMKVLKDGKIALISSDSQNNKYILLSKDNGETWSENKVNLPSESKNKYFTSDSILENGDSIISYTISNDDSGVIGKNDKYKYVMVDLEGKNKDTNLDFIDRYMTKSGKKVLPKNFRYSDSKDLFFTAGNEVIQVDGSTKKEKRKFVSDDLVDNYVLVDDSIIIWNYENVIRYNIKTGEKEDLSKLGNHLKEFKQDKPKLIGNTKSKLYYSNSTGLYCYDMSNNKNTKVIDGDGSRLGVSSRDIVGFSENKDGEFIVAFDKSSNGVFSYTYSKSAKAVPDNRIKVYSLNGNLDMEKNILEYSSANPDVQVEYEVGITKENAATEDDIIKKLNTEILAGKGPDVILLDGLPTDSYIKQGALEDISDIISKYTSKGTVFKGLKTASTVDGKIYSYPTSIRVPVICGGKDVINKISDINSLANTVKDFGEKSDNRIFSNGFNALDIVSSMYYSYGYNWLKKDKTINKENLKKFMTSAKEIYKINNEKYKKYLTKKNVPIPEPKKKTSKDKFFEINNALANMAFPSSLYLGEEPSQLEFGSIFDASSYSSIVTAKIINKQLDYKLLKRDGKNMIIPINQIGINAKSDKKKLAKDFMKYLLSEDVQNKVFDAFPVNKKAFDNRAKKMIHNPNFTPYLDKTTNRTVVAVQSKIKEYWANEEDMKKFKNEIDKVEILPTADLMVLNVVIKEFDSYLKDEIDVDKAVKNVVDNLELYLTE